MSTPAGDPKRSDAYISPGLDFLLLFLLSLCLAAGVLFVLSPS